MTDWERCLAFTLDVEGEWSDNPRDPGGATMKGITLATYTRWQRAHGLPEPTKEDLRNIPDATVAAIYYEWYWLPSDADMMDWPVNLAVFDLAVNGGVGRALEAIAAVGLHFDALMDWRLAWYKRLDGWPIFGAGWERRIYMLIDEAKKIGDITPMAERISDGAKHLNIIIQRATPIDGKVLRVKDIFTTLNGSWEPSAQVLSLPQWARDTYLRPFGAPDYFDDAGADHHLFGGVFNESTGRMVNGMNATKIHYYTATDDSNHVDLVAKEKSGWANNVVYNVFSPSVGQRGAWAWYPKSTVPADIVIGGGMPDNHHVSTFATWTMINDATVPPVDPPSDLEKRVDDLEKWAREVSAEYPNGPQYT